jgi:hypothetical protein
MELVREGDLPKKDTKIVRDGISSGGILKGKYGKEKRRLYMQFFGAHYIFSVQPGLCHKERWLEHDVNHHHLVLWSEWELYVHCINIYV